MMHRTTDAKFLLKTITFRQAHFYMGVGWKVGAYLPMGNLASVVRCIIFAPHEISIHSYKDHGLRLLGCDVR
jgi:hypothetical protein